MINPLLLQDHQMVSPSSTVSTPSKKRCKDSSTTPESDNICRKCRITYGTKMDDEYNSLWINCGIKKCHYWAHLKCLGFVPKVEDNDDFMDSVNLFLSCPSAEHPKTKSYYEEEVIKVY